MRRALAQDVLAGRLRYPTTGFPYTVIYRQVSTGIYVLVVKHDRRRSGFGGGRR